MSSSSLLLRARTATTRLLPVAPLLARLGFGQAFVVTGLGKLDNLPRVVEFFASLGIPLPSVQAPLIATLELVGGIALLLGLATRTFAFLLACTMVVALLTHDGPALLAALPLRDDATQVAPIAPLLTFVWLLAHGAGPVSVDALLARHRRGGALQVT